MSKTPNTNSTLWRQVEEKYLHNLPPPPAGAACVQVGSRVSEALAPWDAQLRRYAWAPKQWIRVNGPLDGRLWALATQAPPGTSMRAVVDSIPPQVLALASQFGAWKHTAVELMALTPLARQLAESFPNMFWLTCVAWASPTLFRVRDAAIFQMNRVNLLSWARGKAAWPSHLALLEKLILNKRDRREHALVRWLLLSKQSDTQHFLMTFKEVHVHALETLRAYENHEPHLGYCPALAHLLDAGAPPPHDNVEACLTAAWDVRRMGKDLGIPWMEVENSVSQCKTPHTLNSLHEHLQFQHTQMLEHAAQEQKASLVPFPTPPLAGNEHIIHLANPAALVQEGKDMHHCIACYTDAAKAGESYLYKVLAPQRATLELKVCHQPPRLNLVQIKGIMNTPVGLATMEAVQAWLSTYPVVQEVHRKVPLFDENEESFTAAGWAVMEHYAWDWTHGWRNLALERLHPEMRPCFYDVRNDPDAAHQWTPEKAPAQRPPQALAEECNTGWGKRCIRPFCPACRNPRPNDANAPEPEFQKCWE